MAIELSAVAAANRAVTTIRLNDLISTGTAELKDTAGVVAVDPLASAGHYVRRAARVMGLDGSEATEVAYRERLGRTVEYFPPLHRTVLNDPLVVGHGTIITRNSLVIEETYRSMIDQGLVPAGLVRSPDGSLRPKTAPLQVIQQPSLLLKQPFWQNYGRWLVDSAALLALLPGLAMPDGWQIVTGTCADRKMQDIVDETLTLLAPGVPTIRHADHELWAFNELHYTSPVSRHDFKLPQAITSLRSLVLSSRPSDRHGRKIYIPRGTHRNRRLDNEQEIMALCASAGFEIVAPETLSLREQAQLFNSADVVMGVKGAALTNLLFCNSSATAIVLSPGSWVEPFFWDIAGQIGMQYIEVLGRPTETYADPASPSFVVDIRHVAEALAEAVSSRGRTRPLPETRPPATMQPRAIVRHTGEFYGSVLTRLHEMLRPKAYLEIGVLDGQSLRRANCPSIGIDPFIAADLLAENVPDRHLFTMSGDQFFATHDPAKILGRPLDLAFLDGMHLFEFLLRDFMNAERFSRSTSWIALHDCMPLDTYMAGRDQHDMQRRLKSIEPAWWTGDVWKTAAILQRYRPDLRMVALNSDPTGLILLTNLDPQSRILTNQYADIVREFQAIPNDDATLARFQAALPVTDTAELANVLSPSAA